MCYNCGVQKSDHTPKEQLLSVVIPIYNEAKNLPALFERIESALSSLPFSHEIIAVDDGSRDNSYEVLKKISEKDPRVRVIRFRTNFGQTAALSAGIEHTKGQVIVTIDSDLENDPADILRLLTKLDEGHDIVSGWRQDRWRGAFFTRRLPSAIANWLISRLSGVHLHDYGCTLKAYRADLVKGVNLYGEMHRFIPAYAAWQGGRVAEILVSYKPRLHGKSNYGLSRTFRVLLDLVVIVFMHRYFNRPMHFFGGWGFASLVFGVILGVLLILLRVLNISSPIASLPIIAALLFLVGVQLMLFGVMAEILMRTYYESQNKRPYTIRETTGTIE